MKELEKWLEKEHRTNKEDKVIIIRQLICSYAFLLVFVTGICVFLLNEGSTDKLLVVRT